VLSHWLTFIWHDSRDAFVFTESSLGRMSLTDISSLSWWNIPHVAPLVYQTSANSDDLTYLTVLVECSWEIYFIFVKLTYGLFRVWVLWGHFHYSHKAYWLNMLRRKSSHLWKFICEIPYRDKAYRNRRRGNYTQFHGPYRHNQVDSIQICQWLARSTVLSRLDQT